MLSERKLLRKQFLHNHLGMFLEEILDPLAGILVLPGPPHFILLGKEGETPHVPHIGTHQPLSSPWSPEEILEFLGGGLWHFFVTSMLCHGRSALPRGRRNAGGTLWGPPGRGRKPGGSRKTAPPAHLPPSPGRKRGNATALSVAPAGKARQAGGDSRRHRKARRKKTGVKIMPHSDFAGHSPGARNPGTPHFFKAFSRRERSSGSYPETASRRVPWEERRTREGTPSPGFSI